MVHRGVPGALVLAAAALLLAGAASASEGGMMGGGIPNPRGPTYDPNQEFHAGVEALDAGRYRAAKQNFEHVLDMVRDQPSALAFLAKAEAGLGDWRGAARDAEASMRADPNQVYPVKDLAIADLKLGRRDKAMAEFQKLKDRAAACRQSCAQAGDFDLVMKQITAAMAPPVQATGPATKTPAS